MKKSDSDREREIIEQYVKLCENPLRGREQILEEYMQLKHHPRVQKIGFNREDVLIIGTDKIVIRTKDSNYSLGQFIIFLVRRRDGKYFQVAFRFWNVTGPVIRVGEGPNSICMHPHIVMAKDKLLNLPNGEMCIQKGQFHIYQSLRKGEMHLVVPEIIRLLETRTIGETYVDLEKWPKLENENAR